MKTAMDKLADMEALVRRMAKQAEEGGCCSFGRIPDDYDEARRIVSELPVEVDRDLKTAQSICARAVSSTFAHEDAVDYAYHALKQARREGGE